MLQIIIKLIQTSFIRLLKWYIVVIIFLIKQFINFRSKIDSILLYIFGYLQSININCYIQIVGGGKI